MNSQNKRKLSKENEEAIKQKKFVSLVAYSAHICDRFNFSLKR